MSTNKIDIEFSAKTRMAGESVHDISDSFVRLSKDGKTANTTVLGLTRTMSGFGKAARAISAVALGKAMSDVTQSAMDMIESMYLYNVSLGELAEDVSVSIEKLGDATGFDKTRIYDTVGEYNMLAKSMGVTNENAAVLSETTNRLALDMASLTNRSVVKVQEDFRSGLIGQSKTMYKYGIDVTEAAIKQEALNQGISKSVRHMSQAEKMQLRYIVMLRQTSMAHGVFADTIETPANQMRVLAERFVTLGRAIGTIFIPMISAALPYLNALVALLTRVAQAIAKLVGYEGDPPAKNMGSGISPGPVEDTAAAMDDVGTGAGKAAKNVGKANKQLKEMRKYVMGFDELNIMPEPPKDTAGSGGAGGAGGAGGGSGFLDDFNLDLGSYDSLIDNLIMKADEIEDKIITMIGNIASAIERFIKNWGLSNVFSGIMDGIKMIDYDSIYENLSGAFDNIKSLMILSQESLQPVAQSMGTAIGTAFKYGIAIVGAYFEPITRGFYEFTDSMKIHIAAWIIEVTGTLENTFDNLADLFEVLGINWITSILAVTPRIVETIELLSTNIAITFGLIVTMIVDTIDIIVEEVLEFFNTNKADVLKYTNNIQNIILDVIDLILKVWNDMLDALSKFWKKWGKDIVKNVMGVFKDIHKWFLKLFNDMVKPVWDNMLSWLNDIWDSSWGDIFETLLDIIGEIMELINNIWTKALKPLIDNLIKFFTPGIVDAFDMVVDTAGSMLKGVSKVIDGLFKVFKGIITFINGVFAGDWGRAWNGIKGIFGGIINGFGGMFKAAMNLIITPINAFLKGLNRIKIPDFIPGIGGKGFNMPTISYLARGGFPDAGGMFWAGESGAELIGQHKGNTTVMPLENTGFVQAIEVAVNRGVKNAIGNNLSGESNIVVKIGERTILDTITDGVNRENRINGKSIITV